MMTEKIIIKGSEMWTQKVPDEYAITCVSRFSVNGRPYEYLVFSYVKPATFMEYEGGFVQKFGQLELMPGWEEIVIIQNDLTSPPAVLVGSDGKLELIGCLDKLAGCCSKEDPEFPESYHYSGRTSGMQKCDENAPEWLKNLAIEHNANVAYFKIKAEAEDTSKREKNSKEA